MEKVNNEPKQYEAPAVVYEAPLEVRAGSGLGIPDVIEIVGG
jgi:hypothetical protein